MIGHSYGSYPIKIYSDFYPHQVDAILLVAPSLLGMFYGNIAKWKPESEQYDQVNLDRMNIELEGWNNPALNPEKIDMKSSAKLIKENTDFEDTPFVLLWAANAVWQGGEAPADWHPNVWERMKTLYAGYLARMQSLFSQTKVVFAKTLEHFIDVYEPEAVLNETNYLNNKIASK